MTCYDEYATQYDAWFLANSNLLMSEVKLVARTLKNAGEILSVGCGSGLFELILRQEFNLTIQDGVEPSEAMAQIARKRGLNVEIASAETFQTQKRYDTILLNGCTSYMADLRPAFANVVRHLKDGGRIVIVDVPKESSFALLYNLAATLNSWDHPLVRDVKPAHPYPIEFVHSALWHTKAEEERVLRELGFVGFSYHETLKTHPAASNESIESPCPGQSSGSYVALIAHKVSFLNELGNGTLCQDRYQSFLAQDCFYLSRHRETLELIAKMAPEKSIRERLLTLSQKIVDTELSQHHQEIDLKEEIKDLGWGLKTLEFVREADFAQALAAIYPCFRLYADAGMYLKNTLNETHPWADLYSAVSYLDATQWLESLLKKSMTMSPGESETLSEIVEDFTREEISYWL